MSAGSARGQKICLMPLREDDQGEAGLRSDMPRVPAWQGSEPGRMTAWVRPNIWYEFLGDPETSFSSDTGFIPFASKLGGSTFEINTGFSADVAEGTSIYANASYLVGLDQNAKGNAYDAKIGIKVAW